MSRGRARKYHNRHAFTTSCEGADYLQFQKACEEAGVDMNEILVEAMRRFTGQHSPQNAQITEWLGSKLIDLEPDMGQHKLPPPFLSEARVWVQHIHDLKSLDELYRIRAQAQHIRGMSQSAIDNLIKITTNAMRGKSQR